MSDTSGRFVWYDLSTPDPSEAIAFYTRVVGLGAEALEEMDDYTMWQVGEESIGGLLAMPEEVEETGVPPHWLAYVDVDDVDRVARRAEELGGSILSQPTDIDEERRFAVLAGVEGAVFAVFSTTSEQADGWTPPRDEPGSVVWHELMTTDVAASTEFFGELFGWQEDEPIDMGDFVYETYGLEGDTFVGVGPSSNDASYWTYYFAVADLEAAIERVEDNGGEVIRGPIDIPGSERIVKCVDPQGAMFAMHA